MRVTYLFFNKFVLVRFPYHSPVLLAEVSAGFGAVMSIDILMNGSQTMKAARSNPAMVLKSE